MSVIIIGGDCRDLLPQREAAEFDCCIADPCYGDTSLEWDERSQDWLPHVARSLKPNGSLWVFGSLRSLAPFFVEAASIGFKYSQDIVWEKQNGTGFHADRFRRVHEHVVMFYRGQWRDVYHQTQYTNDATARTVRRNTRPTHTGHIEAGHYTSIDGGPRMARSVQYFRNEHGSAIHPTQKPVDLVRLLLRYSCPPGGKVLSPFAGSGTDGLAAQIEGMECVMMESVEEYARKSQERISFFQPLERQL
jgi:site-specific DNA-methyltransferase (adenine-specific)